MGEKKQEIMWSWHSVHALINKGLLNKHDWGMFVFSVLIQGGGWCWWRIDPVLINNRRPSFIIFSLCFLGSSHQEGGCCENYRRRLSGRVHSLFKCVFKQKSGPPVCTLKQVSPAVIAHPRSNVCEEEQNPHSVLILCKNTLRSLSEDDMRPQPSAVEPESR